MTLPERIFLAAATELGRLQLNAEFFEQEPAVGVRLKLPAPVAAAPPPPGALLNVHQMAARLNVPVRFLYERTARKSPDPVPHLKLGKFVRFREEDVKRWLEEQRR